MGGGETCPRDLKAQVKIKIGGEWNRKLRRVVVGWWGGRRTAAADYRACVVWGG